MFKKYKYSSFMLDESLKKPFDNFRNITDALYTTLNYYSQISNDIQKFKENLPNDSLQNINDYINNSNKIISNINTFFRDEYKLRHNVKLRDVDESTFESEYENTKSSVHDSAGGLILSVNGLTERVERIDKNLERLSKYEHLLKRMDSLCNTPSFLKVLKDFGLSISQKHWKVFWDKPGKKFKTGPEYIAQTNLSLYLEGKFDGISFVGREIRSGNGFIDVFVNFLGVSYIVELKVIGLNKPIGWAESGLPQLDKYMQKFDSQPSYLIILDGRTTNRGRNLEEYYDLNNGSIHVINVKRFFN